MGNKYDVIIIGAGSVGIPTSYFLGEKGFKTLVLDSKTSPGQGSNKAAIGGIRATHSSPGKILTGLKSLEIFRNWENQTGDNIEYYEGGYTFVTYQEEDRKSLKDLVKYQRDFGLDINFYEKEEILKIVKDLNPLGLLGGTYSPHDGSASPLLSIESFYRHAKKARVEFRFNEQVIDFEKVGKKLVAVKTNRGKYYGDIIINAAGSEGASVAMLAQVEVPVTPESHEGGVTEPVERFISPMIVDIKPEQGSKNFYFYQHKTGQIIFCLTPDPPILGTDTRETSSFLPMVARRMIKVMPKLQYIRVRRTWRGLYPMTPDGNPIVGFKGYDNFLQLVGMCGQGFMLGPGLGFYISELLDGKKSEELKIILNEFSPERKFASEELLK
ncbi:MAG: FAD-binding oxidoreductase [Candidatus Hydrothermia bacterium]|nr:FAD-binding oxidoreductase [Candidatus Hydrothermia bacterium]